MKQTDIFKANLNFVSREIAGEYILVPVGDAALKYNGLVSMNETGVYLWNLLKEEKSYGDICKAFAEEYDLTEEQSREDAADFIKLALEGGLVIQC